MQLRYSIADSLDTQEAALRGYIVVKVNEKSLAKGVRVQQHTTPLNNDEFLINYTKSNINNLNIGAESFFFRKVMLNDMNRLNLEELKSIIKEIAY